MEIKQMLVPEEKRPKYHVNGEQVEFPLTPEYITVHETDNTKPKATADAHARLQSNGNSRQASWHIQVDDKEAIQSIPFDIAAMAAGDGANGPGNRKSIHIEICVNEGGDYEKAVSNAAEITGQLMRQFNIPSHKVVPHQKWSGKNCPRNLLPRWQQFINLVICERGKLDAPVKEVNEVLKAGDKGEAVKVMNYQLASLGYISWKDRENDVFGNTSLEAIKKFQKEQRMKVTGIYDSSTALQFAKILAIYYDRLKKNKLI